MLELSLPRAQTYATPRGPRARTPEGVRAALQILLDPVKRLPFEPWAEAASLFVVVDDPAAPACSAKDAGVDPRGMTWWQR